MKKASTQIKLGTKLHKNRQQAPVDALCLPELQPHLIIRELALVE
jgi:hypothetical protein